MDSRISPKLFHWSSCYFTVSCHAWECTNPLNVLELARKAPLQNQTGGWALLLHSCCQEERRENFVVPWMMLLKTSICAHYQSDRERCDLKTRLNSSCFNENLSKCLKSELSQFLSVKVQFYSREGFCLWSWVTLTSRESIPRQRWGHTPFSRLCPTGNRQFNLFSLFRTRLSLCLCCSLFSGSHPSFWHFAFRGSFLITDNDISPIYTKLHSLMVHR